MNLNQIKSFHEINSLINQYCNQEWSYKRLDYEIDPEYYWEKNTNDLYYFPTENFLGVFNSCVITNHGGGLYHSINFSILNNVNEKELRRIEIEMDNKYKEKVKIEYEYFCAEIKAEQTGEKNQEINWIPDSKDESIFWNPFNKQKEKNLYIGFVLNKEGKEVPYIFSRKTNEGLLKVCRDNGILHLKKRILKRVYPKKKESKIISKNIVPSDYFSTENKYQKIWEIVSQVFSSSWIEEKGLNQTILEQQLTENKKNFPEFDKINSISPLPVIRLIEERNYFRIILLYNPIDDSIQLAFCSLEDVGMNTCFMDIIYSLFKYQNLFRLDQTFSLDFGEETKYPMSPKNKNNRQVFNFSFTDSSFEEDEKKVIKRAAGRQRKHVKNIVELLCLFMNSDLYGKRSIEKTNETITIDLKADNLVYFFGRRIYSHPEFDLIINFNPDIQKVGKNLNILDFEARMKYFPVIKDKSEPKSWTWHHVFEQVGK